MTRIEEDFAALRERLQAGRVPFDTDPSPAEVERCRKELQFDLLRETLSYCEQNVPYYAETWKAAQLDSSRLTSIKDFQAWPILRKAAVVANRGKLLSRAAEVQSFRCTSGTTGRRLPMPVCRAEAEALNQLGALRALASGVKAAAPFVLQIMPPVRRLASSVGTGGMGPVLTTFLNLDAADLRFDFDYVDHVMQCLTESFPNNSGSDRVNVLWTCPPFMVRSVTEALLHRRFDFRLSSIQHIVCSGAIITKALCDYVAAHWRAPLTGFYSMAEIAGSHRRCAETGAYHFDFHAIAEFLDPETLKPVDDGEEGCLVLTSLYPFQQAQPMIRYWTGDLFTAQYSPCSCCFSGVSGIFRGRESECIYLTEIFPGDIHPRLLGSADVLEVLESIPQLPHFHKNPKFRLSLCRGQAPRIMLVVEAYPMSTAMQEDIIRQIRSGLAASVKHGSGRSIDIEVTLTDRGALSGQAGYYPDR